MSGLLYTVPDVAGRVVQEYGSQGPGTRLPDLLVGRENHACGFYVNKEGQIVRVNCKQVSFL